MWLYCCFCFSIPHLSISTSSPPRHSVSPNLAVKSEPMSPRHPGEAHMVRSHSNHLSPNQLNTGKIPSSTTSCKVALLLIWRWLAVRLLAQPPLRVPGAPRDPHPAGAEHGELRGDAAPQETEDDGELEQLARRPWLVSEPRLHPAIETAVCPPQSLPWQPPQPGLSGDSTVLSIRLLHLPGPPDLSWHLRSGLRTRWGLAGHCQTAGSLLSSPSRLIEISILGYWNVLREWCE